MGAGPKGKGKEKEPRERKKPGRIPTSCAECRRLKLKCDKNVPCSKCVSRGCGSICPEGSLTPGKGNRLILANTEELHDRIDQLASRNRELETALRELQKNVSDEPHPLLRTDLLGINFLQGSSRGSSSTSSKSPSATQVPDPLELEPRLEDTGNVTDTFGTLLLTQQGRSKHFGKSARPEYLLDINAGSRYGPRPPTHRISSTIMEMAFPDQQRLDQTVLADVLNHLPSRDEAYDLCDLYLEYGKFLYQPIPRTQLLDEIVTTVYRNEHVSDHYHELSLLFIIFAIATLFDPNKQAHSPDAEEYYYMSRAILNSLQPFTHTTLAAVQTFIHIAQYLDLATPNSRGPDSAWENLGHAVQLSHNIGLHLDANRWKVHDELVERRHDLFWQLFVADTWTNFYVGKPPSISKRQIDCPYPGSLNDTPTSDGRTPLHFHTWHNEYTLLLHSISANILGPKQPVYSTILDFDRKIRDFHVPSVWRTPPPSEEATLPPPEISMCRWLVVSAKEIALLNLHKPFLGVALQESPSDLQSHRYVPSVMGAFRAAWRLIQSLVLTSTAIPKLIARVNVAWSHGMSAAVVMCLLVVRSPTSLLAGPALESLDHLMSLFDGAAASNCQPAAVFLPTLQTLQRKAHEAVGNLHAKTYYQQDVPNIATAELERLIGRTHLVSEHPSSMTMSSLADAASRATSVTMSDAQDTSHPPPFTSSSTSIAVATEPQNLHPTLVQDIRDFRLRIQAMPSMTFYDQPTRSNVPSPVSPTGPQQSPLTGPSETQHHHTSAPAQVQRPQAHRLLVPQHQQHQQQHEAFQNQPQSQQAPHHMYHASGRESGYTPGYQPLQTQTQTQFFQQPMSLPPGFAHGFQSSWLGPSVVLDSSWSSLVGQLGF